CTLQSPLPRPRASLRPRTDYTLANPLIQYTQTLFSHDDPQELILTPPTKDQKLIPLSTASTDSNSGRQLVIDYIPAREQVDIDQTVKDVRNLARVLSNVDPELFGFLPCHSAIQYRDPWTQKITGFNRDSLSRRSLRMHDLEAFVISFQYHQRAIP
ncbi:uncharacterized protein N7496_007684, partial [Penicillium cataractarum]